VDALAFSFLCHLAATGRRNRPWCEIPELREVFPRWAGLSRAHSVAETATLRPRATPAAKRLSSTKCAAENRLPAGHLDGSGKFNAPIAAAECPRRRSLSLVVGPFREYAAHVEQPDSTRFAHHADRSRRALIFAPKRNSAETPKGRSLMPDSLCCGRKCWKEAIRIIMHLLEFNRCGRYNLSL